MTFDWYSVVSGAALEQGDILTAFPLYTVEHRAGVGETEIEILETTRNVVVLTQTCDIENQKVSEILVAEVIDYEKAVAAGSATGYMKSEKFRKDAVNGALPAQHLLPPHENPPMRWSLVEFHHIYSSPLALAQQFAGSAGDRLRLVPPYKEHLAQGIARYFMRVGLPTTLHPFVKDGATSP